MIPLTADVQRYFAICLGASVPMLVFGRSVFAVMVVLGVIGGAVSLGRRRIWPEFRQLATSKIGIMVLSVAVLWIPSVLSSGYMFRSFEATGRTFIFVAAAAVVWIFLRSDSRLHEACLRAFVATSGATVAFALFSQLVTPEPYWFVHLKGWRSTYIGTTLKGYAALGALVIPVLTLAALRYRGRTAALCGLVAMGYLVLVLDTYNRAAVAGLIGAIAAASLAVMLRGRSRRQVLITLAVPVAAIAATVYWLSVSRADIGRDVRDQHWTFPIWLIDFERQEIWGQTLKVFSTSPWFGIGANTINFTPGADRVIEGTGHLHAIPGHPHNWLLEVLAETGAVGLVPMLVAILMAGVELAMRYRLTGDPAIAAAIAVMAGYWISGLFNFSYWSAWWQLAFFLMVVVCHAGAGAARPGGRA